MDPSQAPETKDRTNVWAFGCLVLGVLGLLTLGYFTMYQRMLEEQARAVRAEYLAKVRAGHRQSLLKAFKDKDREALFEALKYPLLKGLSDEQYQTLADLGPETLDAMIGFCKDDGSIATSFPHRPWLLVHEWDPMFKRCSELVQKSPQEYSGLILAQHDLLATHVGRKTVMTWLEPMLESDKPYKFNVISNSDRGTHEFQLRDKAAVIYKHLAGIACDLPSYKRIQGMRRDHEGWQRFHEELKAWRARKPELVSEGYIRVKLSGLTKSLTGKFGYRVGLHSEVLPVRHLSGSDAYFSTAYKALGPFPMGVYKLSVEDSHSQPEKSKDLTVELKSAPKTHNTASVSVNFLDR